LSNLGQYWQIGYALDVDFQGAANEPIPIFQFNAEKKLNVTYFISYKHDLLQTDGSAAQPC
jgi:hypothetical protein